MFLQIGLKVGIIVLCINMFFGFIAYGLEIAKEYKDYSMAYSHAELPYWKKLLLIFLITLLSSIVGLWYLIIMIKEVGLKGDLKWL